jgi:hypothetical protein
MESVAKNASPNPSARLADVGHRNSDIWAPSLYYCHGFDLISNPLAFSQSGRVIRVYDDAGNVIQTHEHKGDFKEW